MSIELRQIKDSLNNCKVLIVEDDDLLAKRIKSLFEKYTHLEPTIARYMGAARAIVTKRGGDFDLVILDIMLPATRQDFGEIQGLEKRLKDLRMKLEGDSASLDESAQAARRDARYERGEALKRIEELIDREGGIKLINEWLKYYPDENQRFTVLFLTALGNNEVVTRGLHLAGQFSDWIVKPIPSDLILEKSANLIVKKLAVRDT
ncbi:MAG: response regulator [Anaerolineae bacterium]|nr:response regulator [Anaerolineae bacterium]